MIETSCDARKLLLLSFLHIPTLPKLQSLKISSIDMNPTFMADPQGQERNTVDEIIQGVSGDTIEHVAVRFDRHAALFRNEAEPLYDPLVRKAAENKMRRYKMTPAAMFNHVHLGERCVDMTHFMDPPFYYG